MGKKEKEKRETEGGKVRDSSAVVLRRWSRLEAVGGRRWVRGESGRDE